MQVWQARWNGKRLNRIWNKLPSNSCEAVAEKLNSDTQVIYWQCIRIWNISAPALHYNVRSQSPLWMQLPNKTLSMTAAMIAQKINVPHGEASA